MGNGAKVGLVGVLALIVLLVALWDRTNEQRQREELKNLPVIPLERPEAKVKVSTPEPAAEDRVRGEITHGPLAVGSAGSAALSPSGRSPDPRAQAFAAAAGRPPGAPPLPAPPASGSTVVAPASPPPAPARPSAEPPRKTYVTKPADSLSRIAAEFYGSERHWRKIAEANKDVIANPDRVPIGVTIVIPPLETSRAGEAPGVTAVRPSLAQVAEVGTVPAGTGPGNGRTYTVQRGDSLYRIAEQLLGSPAKWRIIFDANRDKLPTETSLREGQQLVIPAGR